VRVANRIRLFDCFVCRLQRPRSFAAGEGGDDSAVGSKAKQKATRALPFPRSFTYGTSARDVMKEMTKEQQAAVSSLIESMNAPEPAAAAAAMAPQYDEEVLEYATYFGIDPQREPHLMWIAEEGMDPPLPEGWGEHTDGDGRPYYYCQSTRKSTYEHPYDPYFKDLVARARQAFLEKRKPPSGPPRPKGRGVMFPVGGDAARAGASLGQ
jgi:hypothetical protein